MSARNEVTGVDYRGKNVLRLLAAEAEAGYSDGHGWAGFRQWLSVGRCVRKGEHGTPCLTVITVTDDSGSSKRPRGFRVFHYDQTVAVGAELAEVIVSAAALPAGPDLHREDLRAEGQEAAERHIADTVTYTTRAGEKVTHERVAEPIDNAPETTQARRAMFAGFGWGTK